MELRPLSFVIVLGNIKGLRERDKIDKKRERERDFRRKEVVIYGRLFSFYGIEFNRIELDLRYTSPST